jgi:UDP-glucose 4-epimerase
MTWLITGGAGYIGSHVAKTFIEKGENIIIIDDFSSGSKDRLPRDIQSFDCDIRNKQAVSEILRKNPIEGVIHLAAKKSLPESFKLPKLYFEINAQATLDLLELAKIYKIENFIFSSTSAVYGETMSEILHETHECKPQSPYGKSKLMAEEYIAKYDGVLKHSSLRFFNVSGHENGDLADKFNTALIPSVVERIKTGRDTIIFGNDYPTFDGTCVRDYVDVRDIAMGHYLTAINMRKNLYTPIRMNLGSGSGVSVLQIVTEIQSAMNSTSGISFLPRRIGDIAKVISDISIAQKYIGYEPKYSLQDSILSFVNS